MMPSIAAVIAAAGQSRRMGRPKQLLPWADRTVIETVVANLGAAGVDQIVCVIGHREDEMRAVLDESTARIVVNQHYADQEMLASYQVGMATLSDDDSDASVGTLLALVDQPHVGSEIIQQVVEAALASPDNIIIPSHNMRRGHPIFLPRRLWPELLALNDHESLRMLLDRNASGIVYVNIESDAILGDMDTPEEYERLRALTPSSGSTG
jgi:molybdenum cofactor cytidylyltransferase